MPECKSILTPAVLDYADKYDSEELSAVVNDVVEDYFIKSLLADGVFKDEAELKDYRFQASAAVVVSFSNPDPEAEPGGEAAHSLLGSDPDEKLRMLTDFYLTCLDLPAVDVNDADSVAALDERLLNYETFFFKYLPNFLSEDLQEKIAGKLAAGTAADESAEA